MSKKDLFYKVFWEKIRGLVDTSNKLKVPNESFLLLYLHITNEYNFSDDADYEKRKIQSKELIFDFDYINELGQILNHGKNKSLAEIVELSIELKNASIYIILPSVMFDYKTLTIPGKIDKKILKNLIYQIEDDLIAEPNQLQVHIFSKVNQTVAFAVYESSLVEFLKDKLSQLKSNIKGAYPEALLIQDIRCKSTFWIQTQNEYCVWRINKKFYGFPLSMMEIHVKQLISLANRAEKHQTDKTESSEPLNLNQSTQVKTALQINFSSEETFDYIQENEINNSTLFELQIISDSKEHHATQKVISSFESIGLIENLHFTLTEKQLSELAFTALKKQRFDFFPELKEVKSTSSFTSNKFSQLKMPMGIMTGFFVIFIFNQFFSFLELNAKVNAEEKKLVKEYNQITAGSFKSFEQVNYDFSLKLKKTKESDNKEVTLFDWYSKLPKIFDNMNDVEVQSISFDRNKKLFTIDLILPNFIVFNSIKSESEKYFIVVESAAKQKNGKVETKLILTEPKLTTLQ